MWVTGPSLNKLLLRGEGKHMDWPSQGDIGNLGNPEHMGLGRGSLKHPIGCLSDSVETRLGAECQCPLSIHLNYPSLRNNSPQILVTLNNSDLLILILSVGWVTRLLRGGRIGTVPGALLLAEVSHFSSL